MTLLQIYSEINIYLVLYFYHQYLETDNLQFLICLYLWAICYKIWWGAIYLFSNQYELVTLKHLCSAWCINCFKSCWNPRLNIIFAITSKFSTQYVFEISVSVPFWTPINIFRAFFWINKKFWPLKKYFYAFAHRMYLLYIFNNYSILGPNFILYSSKFSDFNNKV